MIRGVNMTDKNGEDDSTMISVQVKKSFVEAIDNIIAKDTHLNRSDWIRTALREKLDREMIKLGMTEYPMNNKEPSK